MVHVAVGIRHNKKNSITKKPVLVIRIYVTKAKSCGSTN